MKTKEFIKCVEELDFVINRGGFDIEIENESGDTFGTVSEASIYTMDLDWSAFDALDDYSKGELFKLCTMYATTPLKDRKEEEEKYHIKMLNNVVSFNLTGKYLNQQTKSKRYMFSTLYDIEYYKAAFTQKEIDNFPDEVKEILPLCEKIEIKETEK